MQCLVCKSEICVGEQVFYGTQMVHCGPGEDDYIYSEAAGGFTGGVHLICLEKPAETTRGASIMTPESVVSRSDALDMFKGG